MPTRGNVYRWRAQAACWFAALFGGFGCGLVVDTSLPTACLSEVECPSGGACVEGMCRLAILGSETACNSNTQCRAAGSQYCVNGQCIQEPENGCTVWPEGALAGDSDKLLLGFIGDTGTPGQPDDPAEYGTPLLEGVQAALNEIATGDSRGLPGIDGGARRILAVLACKEESSEAGVDYPRRMAQYLVEQAKVPAIIGASYSGDTQDVWLDYMKNLDAANSALLMSPSSTSPLLTEDTKSEPGYDPEDRFWRTAPSDVIQAKLLRELSLTVRNHLNRSASDAKIQIFAKNDAAGQGLMDELVTSLESEFASVDVRLYDKDLGGSDIATWTTLGAQASTFLPDIILPLGTIEFVAYLLPEIEQQWPSAPALRPWYVLPEGDRAKQLLDYANANAELAGRVIGAAPGARNSPLYAAFKASFASRLYHDPDNLAEFGYDAAYLLVYAIARANQRYPSALQLANALNELTCTGGASLSPPELAEWLPARAELPTEAETLSDQFTNLANGECLNFSGASGALDFDENGEALSDIATWCLRKNQDATFSHGPPLAQFYDAENESVVNPVVLSNPNWCPPPPAP